MATQILLPNQFSQQPQQQVPFNADLLRGPAKPSVLWTPVMGLVDVLGNAISVTGSMTQGVSQQGLGLNNTSVSNNLSVSLPATSNNFCMMVIGRFTNAIPATHNFVTNASFQWQVNFSLQFLMTNSYYGSFPSAANAFVVGKPFFLISGKGPSGEYMHSINGVPIGLGGYTDSTTKAQTVAAGVWKFGGSIDATNPPGFEVNMFSVFPNLNVVQLATILGINPWKAWKAPSRRLWAAAAGIAFDAAANSGYQAAASTYTFNRTVTGTNTFLAVDVSLLSAGQTVTSIVDDFGGTNVNAVLVGAQTTVSSVGRVELWRVVAPVAGTKSIQVNLSGSIASSATAVSYTGVHQSSPTEGFNSAQATNVGAADATVNITTVADNCWVHGAIATNDTSITANQTTRNNVTGAGGSGANEDNNAAKTPAGSVTMSYTGVDALATWAIGGYAIRPIAASGLGGTVFTSSLLNGLSAAGKFFRNPLG